MNRIMVIGGTGQLGSAIIEEHNNFKSTDEIISLSSKDINILQQNSIENALNIHKPTVVINTAAYTDVLGAERNPKETLDLNSIALNTLGQCCVERNIALTHISSDYVFGSRQFQVLLEFFDPNPLNVYGVSKLVSEIIVKNLFVPTSVPWQIIRISSLYGSKINNSKGTFVLQMLRKLLNNEKVQIKSDTCMSPTNANDAAIFILKNIKNKSDIYHCNNQGTTSPYQFILHAAKTMNKLGSKINLNNMEEIKFSKDKDVIRPKFSYMGTMHSNVHIMPTWEDALDNFLVHNYKNIIENII